MEVSVSVIIPVWNGRALLETLLSSLRAQTHQAAEVLVIDNGSTDGAPELAARWGATVIRMGHNAGFAAAVNRGIQESRAEWLAILNSDVELTPVWIETMMTECGAWFASGKILVAADESRIDGSWDLVSRSGCPWRAGQNGPDDVPFHAPRTISMASFTALWARAELFGTVGLLDERFGSYLEDVDFGLRCAAAGLRGKYVPAAVSRHHGSAALGRWHPAVTRLLARNQVLLVAKHFPRALRRRWWWPIVAGQALWGLMALRHGAFLAWMRGKVDGLRAFSRFRAEAYTGLEVCLEEGENEIFALQQQIGFDLYWRFYFAFVGRRDTGQSHE